MIQTFMKSMAKKNNKKGFTLVELMVVVVIIGILVAIAIPMYTKTTQTSERRAVEANLRTIDSAIQQYKAANNNSDPANIAALTPDYIASTITGPGDATYAVGGTPLRAQVSSTKSVGGKILVSESLPVTWP